MKITPPRPVTENHARQAVTVPVERGTRARTPNRIASASEIDVTGPVDQVSTSPRNTALTIVTTSETVAITVASRIKRESDSREESL